MSNDKEHWQRHLVLAERFGHYVSCRSTEWVEPGSSRDHDRATRGDDGEMHCAACEEDARDNSAYPFEG